MRNTTVVKGLASAVQARLNCAGGKNPEWFDRWEERINQLVELLPSGSGWDNATRIDLDASHAEKLVLYGAFHHMDEHGGYDGWTDHTIVVTPGFQSLNLRITGRNRNDIKEYLYELFAGDLNMPITWNATKEQYVPFVQG